MEAGPSRQGHELADPHPGPHPFAEVEHAGLEDRLLAELPFGDQASRAGGLESQRERRDVVVGGGQEDDPLRRTGDAGRRREGVRGQREEAGVIAAHEAAILRAIAGMEEIALRRSADRDAHQGPLHLFEHRVRVVARLAQAPQVDDHHRGDRELLGGLGGLLVELLDRQTVGGGEVEQDDAAVQLAHDLRWHPRIGRIARDLRFLLR
jgi:hypothetical protein